MVKEFTVILTSLIHESTAAGLALFFDLNIIEAFFLIIIGSSLSLSALFFLPQIISWSKKIVKPSLFDRINQTNNHRVHKLSSRINNWLAEKRLEKFIWIAIFIISALPIPYTIHAAVIISWPLKWRWCFWVIQAGNVVRTIITIFFIYGGYSFFTKNAINH